LEGLSRSTFPSKKKSFWKESSEKLRKKKGPQTFAGPHKSIRILAEKGKKKKKTGEAKNQPTGMGGSGRVRKAHFLLMKKKNVGGEQP